MSFEETLSRVLNPEGIYWNSDYDTQDPSIERIVQLRIDVPSDFVAQAVSEMERNGWRFTEHPDEASDPQQRLFFQRRQNLLPKAKTAMLTDALNVVFHIQGARLWTWVIVEDENKS